MNNQQTNWQTKLNAEPETGEVINWERNQVCEVIRGEEIQLAEGASMKTKKHSLETQNTRIITGVIMTGKLSI